MDKFSIDSYYMPHGQMGVQTITREEYEASPSMGEQFISISKVEGNPHVFKETKGERKMYFDALRTRNRQQQAQPMPVQQQVPTPNVDTTTSFQCEVITNKIEALKAKNRELMKHGEKYIQTIFDNADKIEDLKKELAALKGEVYKSTSMFISLAGEAKEEEVVIEPPKPVEQPQQQQVQANIANPSNFTPEELAFINENAEAFNQLTNQMLQMQAQGQHVPSLGEMMNGGHPVQHQHSQNCGCGHDHHHQPVQQPMPQQQAPQPQGRMSWADMAQMVNQNIADKQMQYQQPVQQPMPQQQWQQPQPVMQQVQTVPAGVWYGIQQQVQQPQWQQPVQQMQMTQPQMQYQQPMPQQQAPQQQGRMSWGDMAQMVNQSIADKQMQDRGIDPNVHFDFQDAVPLYKIYEAQAQHDAMMAQQMQMQYPQPQPQIAMSQNMAMGNAPKFDFETAVPLDYGFNNQPPMSGMNTFIPPTASRMQPDVSGWHRPQSNFSTADDKKLEEIAARRGVSVESLKTPTQMTWQEAAKAEAIAATPIVLNRLQQIAHEKGYKDIQTLITAGEVDFDAILEQVAQEMTDKVYSELQSTPKDDSLHLADMLPDVYDAKKWLGFANRPEEIENDIHIRNMYINRLNDMVCGIPHNVPWKPENTYDDVLSFLNAYPDRADLEQEFVLELYEDLLLSRGQDPTEGVFPQLPKGQRIISSPHRTYFHGAGLPNITSNTTSAAQQQLGMQYQGQMVDAQMLAYEDQRRNWEMMTTVGNHPLAGYPVNPNWQVMVTPKDSSCLNILVDKFYVPVYDVGYMEAPPNDKAIADMLNNPNLTPEQRDSKVKEINDYKARYNEWLKRYNWEQNKQALFDKLQLLVDKRGIYVKQVNSARYDQDTYNLLMDSIGSCDRGIAKMQAELPTPRPEDPAWCDEQNLLYANYLIEQYNQRREEFERRALRRSWQARGNRLGWTFPMDEVKAQVQQNDMLKHFIPNTNVLTPAEAYLFNKESARFAKEEYESKHENARKFHEDKMAWWKSMWVASYMVTNQVNNEEASKVYDEEDPYGLIHQYIYDPRLQTESSRKLRKMEDWEYPDWDMLTQKRRIDFDEKELRLYNWRMKNQRFRDAVIPVRPAPEWSAFQGRNGQPIMIPTNFYPWATAFSNYKATGDKEVDNKNFEACIARAEMLEKAHRRPTDLSEDAGYYKRAPFQEALSSYKHKTRIGQVSDLLEEYEDDEQFKDMMNNYIYLEETGKLAGYDYNKDRVNFENSILEQFLAVGQNLPKGSCLKDPEFDTYNGKSMESIAKHQVELNMQANDAIKAYLSPELGGTYDSSKHIS